MNNIGINGFLLVFWNNGSLFVFFRGFGLVLFIIGIVKGEGIVLLDYKMMEFFWLLLVFVNCLEL